MRLFIFKLSLFCVVSSLILIILGSPYVFQVPRNDYNDSIIDKHQCMKRTINNRRIVMVGDSNLTYGLDSEAIEKKFGYPVCNIALNAELGLQFMIREALDLVKPGDIVLFSTSWNLGSGSPPFKGYLQTILPRAILYSYGDSLSNSLKTFIYMQHSGIRHMYRRLLFRIGDESMVKQESLNPKRISVNRWGDYIAHLKTDKRQSNFLVHPILLIDQKFDDSRYVYSVSKLSADLSARNIIFLYVFPPYPRSMYDKQIDVIRQYGLDLRRSIKTPILGETDSFIYDDDLFYDSDYHLLSKGRQMRTDLIIKLIVESGILNDTK